MMNTKTLPRPLRRRVVSDLAARLPIPYVVTCAGMGLAWPHGNDVPTIAEAHSRPATPVRLLTACEECGETTNGGSRYCGWCDPLAD